MEEDLNKKLSVKIIEKKNFIVKLNKWQNDRCIEFEFDREISDSAKKLIEEHIKKYSGYEDEEISGFDIVWNYRELAFFIKDDVDRKEAIDYVLNFIDNLISTAKFEYQVLAILKKSATDLVFILAKKLVDGIRWYKPFGVDSVIVFVYDYGSKNSKFPLDMAVPVDGDFLRGSGEFEGDFELGGIKYRVYVPNTIPGIENIPRGKGMKTSSGYLTAEGVEMARFATLTFDEQQIRMKKIAREDWKPYLDSYNLVASK